MTKLYINQNTKESTEDMVKALRWFVEEGANVMNKLMDGKRLITKNEWKHGNPATEEYLAKNLEAHI